MKITFNLTLCLILLSCYNVNKEDQLNQRITILEQRMDSLTGNNKNYPADSYSLNTPWENDRCRAITKRGKHCRRKAKSNGYCWQHRE